MEWIATKITEAFQTVMGWLLDALNAIGQFFATLFGNFWDWISDVVVGWWATVRAIIEWVWTWVLDVIQGWWQEFLDWFYTRAWPWVRDTIRENAADFRDWLQGQLDGLGLNVNIDAMVSAFDEVADVYADVAWLLPMNQVLGIVATTFLAVAFLRLVRWVLSLIWISG